MWKASGRKRPGRISQFFFMALAATFFWVKLWRSLEASLERSLWLEIEEQLPETYGGALDVVH